MKSSEDLFPILFRDNLCQKEHAFTYLYSLMFYASYLQPSLS